MRSSRPPLPRFARLTLWATGTLALLLLFAPALYVVKYYGGDRQREQRQAASLSRARIAEPDVNKVAPRLSPFLNGNAAVFYARAVQSYARRSAGTTAAPPTASEMADIVNGGRCETSHWMDAGLPPFHDAGGQNVPYTFPVSPRVNLHYLSAATRLAAGMAGAAPSNAQKALFGRALLRFGESVGRERATRVHMAVATDIERMGARLLLSSPTPALQKFVDARQKFEEAVQKKYAVLQSVAPDNLLLQTRVAQNDPDPLWRREAVWAALGTLSQARFAWAHPLEAAGGKAALASVAAHDPDVSVRNAASFALETLAQAGGATLYR